jgi:hypothetical protein
MNILSRVSTVQASTNDNTLVASSILNASRALAISFTIENSGDESIDWEVVAGNASDLSDASVIQASATIASTAHGTYGITVPPYAFYGVNIVSSAPDTPGEGTISAIAKG